ncbi:PREDICTED: elongation of very long chain fatty acids protein 2-like [Priapulus caudatus]|uniref:Elongation of very long chain fatty acids protein n=1 Tax=Priapulus caudatus TaxID=37621 RepID=A0ABM1F9M4_PRICU|nr:PREDICTED: elongation of very long chain fatty acids protein 2-like [Priapulus caudatus]
MSVYCLGKELKVRSTLQMSRYVSIYPSGTSLYLSVRYTWPAIAVMLGLNSFVHVLLYCYYGVTVLHGRVDVGWKRALTQLQILQFVVGMMFGGWGYLHHGFCIYSMLYGLTMTLLFSNYYRHAYM